MASWHNNFASPANFPISRDPNYQVLPSQWIDNPSFLNTHAGPDGSNEKASFYTPSLPHVHFPPPSLITPPPFLPNIPPPMINTALPPPFMPPPPNVPPYISTISSNTITSADEKFEKLKSDLEEHYNRTQLMSNIKKPENLKISDVKGKLVKCFSYIEQLESLTNCLQLAFKTLPEEEWFNHCEEAKNVKAELAAILKEITEPNFVRAMKKAVLARKKKREYRRRKILEYQEKKRVAKLNSEQETRNIDMWLEKMKDQVSRAKREEDIKREADLVLYDVNSKKAEAKRMLKMLNALAKLRTARVQNLSSETKVSDQGTKAFNEIIDRLKSMWLEQFSGYKVEEEGLKVMLGHAEEERLSIETFKLRKNLNAWSQGIFGSSSLKPLTVEELIEVRKDWDTFICYDNAPMASSIPVGWVLPCKPSSEEWAKLL